MQRGGAGGRPAGAARRRCSARRSCSAGSPSSPTESAPAAFPGLVLAGRAGHPAPRSRRSAPAASSPGPSSACRGPGAVATDVGDGAAPGRGARRRDRARQRRLRVRDRSRPAPVRLPARRSATGSCSRPASHRRRARRRAGVRRAWIATGFDTAGARSLGLRVGPATGCCWRRSRSRSSPPSTRSARCWSSAILVVPAATARLLSSSVAAARARSALRSPSPRAWSGSGRLRARRAARAGDRGARGRRLRPRGLLAAGRRRASEAPA